VKLVLPGAVDTEIWDQPDNEAPLYNGPMEAPGDIAGGIADAIDSERFEHYLPDMKAVVEYKTTEMDNFLLGMRDMADQSPPAARGDA
jgi:short-subunit dehydrogenase